MWLLENAEFPVGPPDILSLSTDLGYAKNLVITGSLKTVCAIWLVKKKLNGRRD